MYMAGFDCKVQRPGAHADAGQHERRGALVLG